MATNFKIGQKVRKSKPLSDYTFGRIGEVVDNRVDKVKVRWIYEPDGSFITTCGARPGNGVRTWVNSNNVEII